MTSQQFAEIRQLGIPYFLGVSWGQSLPGNDRVIPDWDVTYDNDGSNGLTAFGNVKPKSNADVIDLLVVAFTSPDYSPNGQGKYYTGYWASIFSPPATAPGTAMGFILQSQQFTESDQGKTVAVHLQGWVDTTLFGFKKTIGLSTP